MPNVDRLKLEVRRSAGPFGLVVILIVLAGIAAGGIARNLTFERPWQDYREVRAEFDDAKGIFPKGHQVRVNGVRVGVVKEANLENGRAVLTLSIEKKWGPIYRDAEMRIRPVTPLQDLYVNITKRGTPAAGEATTKDIIAAKQTVSPVDVSRVLNTFNADTRERMTILLSELGKGLGPQGGEKLKETFAELAPFLKVAEDATEVLRERQTETKRVVTNFGRLSKALAKRDTDLNKFVRQGNVALGELARNDAPLGATFDGLGELVPQMRSTFAAVETLGGRLDPALRSLKPVTEELQSGLDGLQDFGRDATPALKALRPAVNDLRTMSRQLAPTSRDLNLAFARLRQQAPQFDSITENVLPCLTDGTLERFFNNTLSVLKFGDANGTYPRAETTVDVDTFQGSDQGLNTRGTPYCSDNMKGSK